MTSDPNYPGAFTVTSVPSAVMPSEFALLSTCFVVTLRDRPVHAGKVISFVGEGYFMLSFQDLSNLKEPYHQRLVHVSEMGHLFDPVDYKWLFFSSDAERDAWLVWRG